MLTGGATEVVAVPDRAVYRVGIPTLVLVGLGFCVLAGLVAYADSEGHAVIKVVLFLVAGSVAVVITQRPHVVVTPTHLISRSLSGSTSVRWCDILSIAVSARMVNISTTTRTIDIHRNLKSARGQSNLARVLPAAWVDRRGEDWHRPALEPWEPSLDVHERFVLRRPFGDGLAGLAACGAFFGSMFGQTLTSSVTAMIGVVAIVVALATAVSGVRYLRVAVIVTPDAVTVREVFREQRILRTDVLAVAADGLAPASQMIPRRARRVFITTTNGPMRLPAPASDGAFSMPDPLFFRKLAWLAAELSPRPSRAAVVRDSGSVRSG